MDIKPGTIPALAAGELLQEAVFQVLNPIQLGSNKLKIPLSDGESFINTLALESTLKSSIGFESFGPCCIILLKKFEVIKGQSGPLRGKKSILLTELEVLCDPVELIGVPKCFVLENPESQDLRVFSCGSCGGFAASEANFVTQQLIDAYAFRSAEGVQVVNRLEDCREAIGFGSYYALRCSNCLMNIGRIFAAFSKPEILNLYLLDKAVVRLTDVRLTPASPTPPPPQLVSLIEETASLRVSAEELQDPMQRFEERLTRLENTVAWLVDKFQQRPQL